uniref:histidine kinase n=1 Tax=candidate division WOR-3 bacterium TaxID=2052148 RepID=A0A7C4Y4S7_UNCW3
MRLPFRYKVSIVITSGVIIIYVVLFICFYLSSRSKLKNEFFNNAKLYSEVTYDKFSDIYTRYYRSVYFKFREFMLTHIRLFPDLQKVQIVSPEGEVLFNSEDIFKEIPVREKKVYTDDRFVIENLKTLEVKTFNGDVIKIIHPYIDRFGVHRFSIIYYFSYERLKKEINGIIKISFTGLILILILSSFVSIFLSRLITSHLSILEEAAMEISGGNFSKKIIIKTNDEFQDLADTFNLMTEKIREFIKELKERDRQKTQFIANISHELRTPLTASFGYVDYLLKEKIGIINEKQRKSLEIIKRNLERLNRDIHSLLQISKYYLEGVELDIKKTDVEKILKDILQNLSPHIENKKITTELDIKVKECFTDQEKIRNVFENILINAVKFTPEQGFIKIRNSLISENGNSYVIFDFYNNSEKIPPKKLDLIFEPFYQVDSDAGKKLGGIGLGLSICKSIIEAHNGKIWAKNDRIGFHIFFKIPGGVYEKEEDIDS